jgi:hypothetical protein
MRVWPTWRRVTIATRWRRIPKDPVPPDDPVVPLDDPLVLGLEGNELAKLVGRRQDVLPQGEHREWMRPGRRRSKGERAAKEFTKPLLGDSHLRHFQAHWTGRPNWLEYGRPYAK